MSPARRRTSKVETSGRQGGVSPPPADRPGDPALDPWAVLKASQAISAELALGPLARRLAQELVAVTGADRAHVISCREGKLLLEAEAIADRPGEPRSRSLESVPLEPSGPLPLSLIQLVVRSRRSEKVEDGACSRLCVPVGKPGPEPGALAGLLHLESDCTDAFGAGIVLAVERLADQAAISLDHARIHREMQTALRVREEFLSVAAHELYTPLASLKLVLDTLSPTVPETPVADSAVFRRSVDIARRQGRRLERLIGELLEVSRLDTGKVRLNLHEVDLGLLVQEVVEHFAPEASRAACPLRVAVESAPVLGFWDRSRLDQVIANLVSNAIKFGAGQPVDLLVSRSDGTARLVVRDRGMGIDPREQGHIFDRFQRTIASRHFGGLGLGLYICRAIVQVHGGSISVESSPGAGATFTVELPLTP